MYDKEDNFPRHNNLSSSGSSEGENPHNHFPKEKTPENSPSNNQGVYSRGKIVGAIGILTILVLGGAYLIATFFKTKKSKKN